MNYRNLVVCKLTLLIALVHSPALAQIEDVIEFDNGDQMTGEFKTMQRGRLNIISYTADTVDVHWQKTAYITVDRDVLVEAVSGMRYSGPLIRSDDPGKIVVVTSSGPVTLEILQVAAMVPLDSGSLRDLNFTVSAGYNFAKANSVEQGNVGIRVTDRTTKHLSDVRFSSNFSDSSSNESSQRQYLIGTYSRLLPNRWLASGSLSLDTNDELNISLRSSLGFGGGRILEEGPHSFFSLQGGLLLTKENLQGAAETTDSIESYVDLQWDWFQFSREELDWSNHLRVIPSLTESGRVRADLNTSLNWKIVGQLGWQLEFYGTYDSQPQTVGAENTDYGVNTSASYRF